VGLFDNMAKGNILTGLAIGVGAAVVAPAVLPVLAQAARPLAKAAMKSGILLFERGREIMAEAGELAEDLWAEARAEIEEETAGMHVSPRGEDSGGGAA